jgi:hypothetical protein
VSAASCAKAARSSGGGEVLSETTWERHSNPWSGWTRLLTYPLVFVPAWNHSWLQAVPVIIWLWLNPRLFPPPKDASSWMTRGVLGEQRWVQERPIDLSLLLNLLMAPSFLAALSMAHARRLRGLLLLAAVTAVLKLWFIDRMTVYYARHGPTPGSHAPEPYASTVVVIEGPEAMLAAAISR